jgi:Phosphotransferase enzyme family
MNGLVQASSVDLDWVGSILAAPPAEAKVERSGSPSAPAFRETFGVFPTAASPRVLVPLASRRAAAAALAGSSHAREPHVRLARVLLRIGLRAGIAQHLLRDRLSISLGEQDNGLLPDVLLTQHLTEVFGRRDIAVAVRIGRARPNRKPLIQVLTPDGEVVGYVKVGWNPLTRRLVRNEARVLTDLARESASRAAFEAPQLLHAGEWRQLEILALAPLHGRLFRGGRSGIAAAAAAMNEISRLSDGREGPLGASDYWRTTRGRITAVANGGRLSELADTLEARHGDDILPFGSWHGDWTPWNMAWRGGALAVWDWERSGDAVPVGLDAAHFDFQVALRTARHRWDTALRETLAGEMPLLSALSLPNNRARLLLSLHLLEMSLRSDEGRRAGVSPPDAIYLPALAALLDLQHSS